MSELRPGSQDIWFGLSMARFVGVLTTRVCGEGTFGCSSALTPLVSCSSCSLGTASAAFCSFICGHVAYARVMHASAQVKRYVWSSLGVGPRRARIGF